MFCSFIFLFLRLAPSPRPLPPSPFEPPHRSHPLLPPPPTPSILSPPPAPFSDPSPSPVARPCSDAEAVTTQAVAMQRAGAEAGLRLG